MEKKILRTTTGNDLQYTVLWEYEDADGVKMVYIETPTGDAMVRKQDSIATSGIPVPDVPQTTQTKTITSQYSEGSGNSLLEISKNSLSEKSLASTPTRERNSKTVFITTDSNLPQRIITNNNSEQSTTITTENTKITLSPNNSEDDYTTGTQLSTV
eukprot:UN25686